MRAAEKEKELSGALSGVALRSVGCVSASARRRPPPSGLVSLLSVGGEGGIWSGGAKSLRPGSARKVSLGS